MNLNRTLHVALLLLFFYCQSAVTQEVLTGTIEHLDQDNGFVTISGQRHGFSDQATQVFIADSQVGAQTLDIGMVVRYTLNASGTLLRVEIIGPDEKLQFLRQN